MKKLFIICIFFIIFYLFPGLASADVPVCDPVTGVGCTWCIDRNDGVGCVVDDNKSSYCTDYGGFPDPSVCSGLSPGCPNQAWGLCISAPSCGDTGEICVGPSGTQDGCCDGLICNNGTCSPPAVCRILTELCSGPAGTQGGCCNGLICQVTASGELRCQNPPNPVTGYFCETSGLQCFPCHSGDLNSGCNPAPQYSDYNICTVACTGQIPTKFICQNGNCVENQNGPYSDIGTCAQNCSPISGGSNTYDYSYSGLRFANLEAVLTPVAKILFYASLVIGALFIIYAGYTLMTSEGNPQRVQQGQEQLTAAILGIIFVLLSAAILRVIINSILVV